MKCHPLDDLRINNPHVFQHYPSQYDMLFVADYVISDYSTVIYEAGLLDLPVFLYAYDWPDYSRKRSLYIDPKRDIPTLFTDDAEAIVRAIEHDDLDHAAYQAFIRRNVAIPEHGSCTARSRARIRSHRRPLVRFPFPTSQVSRGSPICALSNGTSAGEGVGMVTDRLPSSPRLYHTMRFLRVLGLV